MTIGICSYAIYCYYHGEKSLIETCFTKDEAERNIRLHKRFGDPEETFTIEAFTLGENEEF